MLTGSIEEVEPDYIHIKRLNVADQIIFLSCN